MRFWSSGVRKISASRPSPWRLVFATLAILFFASSVLAQTDAYAIRGNATAGSNNIWSIDLTTSVETLVYTNYPGGNAATLAQRPSDGMIFYSINATNGAVYRFNPATPSIAPVAIGNLGPSTGGVDVSGGFRMAFNGNTLYYMVGNAGTDANTVYTLNQNTGQATKVATVTGTNNGGDIAFNGSTLYIIDQDKRVCSYAGLPANGAAGGCSTVAVGDTNSIGIAFNSSGQMLLQTVTNANLYRGTTLITALSGGNTATGDLATADVPAPNLSITKTDGLTTVYRGGPVSYTVVVTNSGTYTVTGSVVDTVPASVTGVNWTCVASAGSSCAAASGSGNSINTSATLEAGDIATYTITGTLSASASGTLVNTATVAVPAWLTDSAPANNTATDTDTINLSANLGITKTDGVATINSGSPVTYTIVVSNAGPDASNGSIVTDTVPASITGVNWTCGSVTGGATCGAASGSGNSINTTANLPSGSSVTYTVTGTLSPSATGTLSNTATVLTPASGVSDPTDLGRTGAGNNSATDNTPINAVPDLRIAKSHSGNFTVGVNGTYTLTPSNAGSAATSGTVTVVDNLPAGLTVASIPTGTGWNCAATVVGSSTATCTSATAIAVGANGNAITLTVVVAPAAFPSVTNSATVSGGGEPASNNGNNSTTDPTTVNGVSDMTVVKSHVGNFTQGQVGATYSVTATNSGTAATSGIVTVTDTLPAGLTATAISGTGWTCVLGTLTCTRNDVLAVSASYPVITLTVTVANNAPSSVTNSVSVSGGGQNNTGNDTATNPTTINQLPDMTIAKSHVGNFTQGQVGATYSITATNSGSAATSGTVTVVDTLPAGLTATAISGTGWSCVLGTLTCTRSDALAASSSYPVITVTVTVANNAAASVTNSVSVSGGGQTNTGNDTATDPTTINQLPDLTIAKTHVGNFTQGQVGATYSITATNSGFAATSGTVTVTDALPAGLTATAIGGTGWSCVLGTLTCTRSDALAAGSSYPVITLTVNVANNAASSVTNSVSVSGGGQTNTSNDTATNPTTINQLPDLTIAKTHVGNFTQGQVGATYSITATNSGSAATSGTVTVTDALPAGLTATAISGTGWSCVLGTLTCTRSDALAAGLSYPVITLTVNVANNAPSSVTNSVSVSGGGQTNTSNDTGTNPTTINQLPDMTIAKSHVGNFAQGQVGATYSLTATNSGSSATSGTVTVVDTLPAGLTATAISGTGWSCVLGTLTCTRSDALAGGSSYPVITVTVTVANNAASSVTNSASVSGGGQINTTNDSANDPTTINQLPDMTIAKSHVGNFTQGQVGATYSLTATNSGFAATSGTVTVVDTLPAGLTATAISGTGWSCVLGTLTCTRSDALAGGSSYPVITVTVNVANNAPASVTNSASVSGGGQTNTSNDTATNPTTINQLPDLTIAKSHVGNFTQGQTGATYTLTATNAGSAATSGTVTVVDTLPAGLTATAISGTGWSCVLGTLTCTRSDALAAGSSYPAITVTVNVALSAPASVTNTANVSGGGQTNTTNDSASDPTTINAAAPPSIGLVKSVSPGGTQLPGTDLLYTIVYTNTGGQPANNFVLTDPNPANAVPAERVFHNVDFKVASLTSSPGTSGLVATFQYSNDGGTTWTYTPVSGAGGAPAGYDRNVTNVRWSFAGSLSQAGPNNTGTVTLTVRIR
ncbi:MAG TPA: hypothetical protein VLL54_09240 [Pyrinomonadaceae bacterium]|nr:hypothetical protein [Pyrinomonadaceae bacterium]